MSVVDDVKIDQRFYIDDANFERLFSSYQKCYKYNIEYVRVGSILRFLDNKITCLYDTDVYPYIKDSKKGSLRYKKYCNRCNVNFRTPEKFQLLLEELRNNEYDIRKGAIVVDEQNFILDGQHRLCFILYKYGPFHKIPVVKVSFREYVRLRKRLRLILICITGNLLHIDEIIASFFRKH